MPYGWTDFCRRYAGECDGGPLASLDVNLIPQVM
jgi:predicted transglutaminase-like cysteine proteinase